MGEQRTGLTLLFVLCFIVVSKPNVDVVKANPLPIASLKMPTEYINYTITQVNGSLWAKVDGTYPLYKFEIECKNQLLWTNNTWFTFSGEALQLVYPTPPSTTNISLKMNETELKWSNYTQTHPDALHHTTLGDWPMISSTITVLDHFTLKIHYEHPIEVVNGNNTLLYDLNINPYLSPWSNKSTAYFNIRFEPNYTNLQVNTISVNEAINPLNYEITKDGISEVVKLQIVSEYSKPLLGDLSVSFTQDEVLEQTTSGISNSVLQTEDALVGAMLITTIGFAGLLSIKHNKETKKDA